MKAKRAKQYRKLMQQYGLTFGVREPYQVIIDAQIIQDSDRFKMDLVKGLERTLSGKVKPMITQCSMRHLYDATPKNDALIEQAKTFERRRCNHHLLDEPLSTLECLSSVIDPKDQNVNKYHYIVACQDDQVRAKMRGIPGVPQIYIKRSIMILEPMAGASEDIKARAERSKFKSGISRMAGRGSVLGKRARENDVSGVLGQENGAESGAGMEEQNELDRMKRRKGPKGPNPLSVKKPKLRQPQQPLHNSTAPPIVTPVQSADGEVLKRKRKRKHKGKQDAGGIDIADD